MKTAIVQWSCTGALVLTLVPFITNAQFRLDQFTNSDPSKAALQLADGSLTWAMEVDDTTFLWKGDAGGDPQWARSIVDPGTELQLVEGANSSTMMVEAYYPTSQEISPVEDLVTQRLRVTRISEQGLTVWSKQCDLSFAQPYEFSIFSVTIRSAPTADGGLLISVINNGMDHMTVCHILRFTPDGDVAWCKRMGNLLSGGYLIMSHDFFTSEGLLLTELAGGQFAATVETNDPPWDIAVHTFDAQGNPLQSRALDYTGSIIYRRTSWLTTAANGELLIGGRMSTTTSANVMVYRLDEDLDVVDGDVYWDFGITSSPELAAVVARSDGNRVIEVVSAGGSEQFTYLLEVNESGDILHSTWSAPLPYTDGQTLLVTPKHLRYDDTGIQLAHTLRISHPVLGNMGHFSERSLIDPSAPECYFSINPVGHVQIPDSLVSMLPLANYDVLDVVPGLSDVSPLIDHSVIGTVQGCQLQIGMAEQPRATMFDLVISPSVAQVGDEIAVRSSQNARLEVFDVNGRMVIASMALRAGAASTIPTGGLTTGAYALRATGLDGMILGTARFVVE